MLLLINLGAIGIPKRVDVSSKMNQSSQVWFRFKNRTNINSEVNYEGVMIPQDLDTVLEALANKHRREMVYVLGLQPCSISQLASMRDLSLPAVHKHVRILENAGMVVRKKIGRTNFLMLDRHSMRGLQEWLAQFHTYWGSEEETLKNYAQYLGREQTNKKVRP